MSLRGHPNLPYGTHNFYISFFFQEILLNIDEKETTKHEASQSTQFDTRIQAGIRWRDWKLLTGHPGYPLWVPAPQVDYTLCKYCRCEN